MTTFWRIKLPFLQQKLNFLKKMHKAMSPRKISSNLIGQFRIPFEY